MRPPSFGASGGGPLSPSGGASQPGWWGGGGASQLGAPCCATLRMCGVLCAVHMAPQSTKRRRIAPFSHACLAAHLPEVPVGGVAGGRRAPAHIAPYCAILHLIAPCVFAAHLPEVPVGGVAGGRRAPAQRRARRVEEAVVHEPAAGALRANDRRVACKRQAHPRRAPSRPLRLHATRLSPGSRTFAHKHTNVCKRVQTSFARDAPVVCARPPVGGGPRQSAAPDALRKQLRANLATGALRASGRDEARRGAAAGRGKAR